MALKLLENCNNTSNELTVDATGKTLVKSLSFQMPVLFVARDCITGGYYLRKNSAYGLYYTRWREESQIRMSMDHWKLMQQDLQQWSRKFCSSVSESLEKQINIVCHPFKNDHQNDGVSASESKNWLKTYCINTLKNKLHFIVSEQSNFCLGQNQH